MPDKDAAQAARKPRVHVFVDFWNFHLTLKKVDEPFSADFKALGPALVKAAMEIVDKGVQAEYAGMGVYMSTNERSEAEAGLRRWATQVVDRFPGVNVTMIPRVKEVQAPRNAPLVMRWFTNAPRARQTCEERRKKV